MTPIAFNAYGQELDAFVLEPGDVVAVHESPADTMLLLVSGQMVLNVGDAIKKTFTAPADVSLQAGALYGFSAEGPATVIRVYKKT